MSNDVTIQRMKVVSMSTAVEQSVQVVAPDSAKLKTVVGRIAKPHKSIRGASGVILSRADGMLVGAYNMEQVLDAGLGWLQPGDMVAVTLDGWKRGLVSGRVSAGDVIPLDDVPWGWVKRVDTDVQVRSLVACPDSVLTNALRFCGLAVSRDASRPVLTTIQVSGTGSGTVSIAASDSYRLHVVESVACQEVASGESWNILLPGIVTKLLRGKTDYVGSIGTAEDGQIVSVNVFSTNPKVPPYTLHMRAVPGTFPNWQQLKPTPSMFESSLLADQSTFPGLVDSLKRAKVCTPRNAPMLLDPASGVLTDRSGDGFSFPWIPANGDEPMRVGMNPGYTLDAVKGLADLGAGSFFQRAISPLRPILFEAVSSNAWALVMPVRRP